MNSSSDFWARVDRRGGGPSACWPWRGARDRQGRGKCRFAGAVRYTHQVIFYLTNNTWPRPHEVLPCETLRNCCNPQHLRHREPKRRRSFERARHRVDDQIAHERAFILYLAQSRADIYWLCQLVGDRAGEFLREHAGRTIRLEMHVPSRAELAREACAIDCALTMAEAKPDGRASAIKRLAAQYQCGPVEITDFVTLGSNLLSSKMDRNEKSTKALF